MSLDELYRQVIMDHYQHPRNVGTLPEGAVSVRLRNPTCGDTVELYLAVEGDRIAAARFRGEGCSISMASASMMTEAVTGQRVTEARELAENFRRMLRGEPVDEGRLGDLAVFSGVSRFPMRIKCATLAFQALEQGLEEWGGGSSGEAHASDHGEGEA